GLLSARPRAPVFPYTTLFRSAERGAEIGVGVDDVTEVERVSAVRHLPHPVVVRVEVARVVEDLVGPIRVVGELELGRDLGRPLLDRKSTRLNSSHVKISYAVL